MLDAFMGGGTTLIEAWLLNRPSIGIDISKLAYQTTSALLDSMEALSRRDNRASLESKYKLTIILGDSTFNQNKAIYDSVDRSSVRLLCVHPPYLDALSYTNGHPQDLSRIRDIEQFLKRISAFAERSKAYLASNNVCAVLIGDVRRDGHIFPLGARTLDTFLDAGFQLNEIIVKTQHRDRSNEFYYSSTGSHLLAHEYLYIFSWPSQEIVVQC